MFCKSFTDGYFGVAPFDGVKTLVCNNHAYGKKKQIQEIDTFFFFILFFPSFVIYHGPEAPPCISYLDFPIFEPPGCREPGRYLGKPPSMSLPVDDLWTVFSAGCMVL